MIMAPGSTPPPSPASEKLKEVLEGLLEAGNTYPFSNELGSGELRRSSARFQDIEEPAAFLISFHTSDTAVFEIYLTKDAKLLPGFATKEEGDISYEDVVSGCIETLVVAYIGDLGEK